MHSVSLELPVKIGEAARLAILIFNQAEGRHLNHDLRNRLSARMQELQLASIVPLGGSLQRDPIHPSTYYLAADTRGAEPQHWLLRLALASSPSSGLFPKALLVGRMRTSAGAEVVVNAIRFDRTDRENIRTFAEQVDPQFLPRPQGAAPAICVEHAIFEPYRAILRTTGVNLAAVSVTDGMQVDTAVWAAIRSGWREGYTIETEIGSLAKIPPGCTKFTVRAGGPLQHLVNIYDAIRSSCGRKFDFEVSFASAPGIVTPDELATCLQFLESRGKPAQFAGLRYQKGEQLASLAATARQFGAILSVRSDDLLPLDDLDRIGEATGGRVSYKICNAGTSGTEISRLIPLAAEHLRA